MHCFRRDIVAGFPWVRIRGLSFALFLGGSEHLADVGLYQALSSLERNRHDHRQGVDCFEPAAITTSAYQDV